MEDQEVGKLWQECVKFGWTSDNYQIPRLIQKLVEERTNYYKLKALITFNLGYEPRERALRDFGLPPAIPHEQADSVDKPVPPCWCGRVHQWSESELTDRGCTHDCARDGHRFNRFNDPCAECGRPWPI